MMEKDMNNDFNYVFSTLLTNIVQTILMEFLPIFTFKITLRQDRLVVADQLLYTKAIIGIV